MPALLPFLVMLLTCAPDAADDARPEPTPLAAVPIDAAALGRIGSAEYVFQRRDANGELTRIGTFTMQTTVDARNAVMLDTFDGAVRSGKVEARWKLDCLLAPGLPMTSAASVETYSPADGHPPSAAMRSLKVENGRATVQSQREPGHIEDRDTFDFPMGVVVDFALMRIVPLLDRTPGARWSAPAFFETEDMAVRDEAVIVECVGPATIMVIQRQVECTRYRLLRDGKPRAEYFVGPDGSLERIEFDDVKVLDRRLPKVG